MPREFRRLLALIAVDDVENLDATVGSGARELLAVVIQLHIVLVYQDFTEEQNCATGR